MKIVILEDEGALLSLLVRVLTRSGHKVDAAETSKLACQLIQEQAYDLVITDRQLPDDDGELKTLRLSKNLDDSIPVIVMSGEYDDQIVADAMAAGANHFLRKPFTIMELLNLVAGFKKE